MEKKITLFHGSEKVIEHPVFGAGKKHNDFGLGFYCTESEALAKEWAVSSLRDGFANRYTLDTEYLHILNLNSPDYTILNWIAVLVEHRLFSIKTPVARRAKQYLIENFSVNVNAYDLITGYRADDSYFDYAESFLNNAISVEQLSQALHRAMPSVPPPLATAARWTPAVPTCRWRWPGTSTPPRPAARGPWKRSPLSMRKATAAPPTAPLPMPAVKP